VKLIYGFVCLREVTSYLAEYGQESKFGHGYDVT